MNKTITKTKNTENQLTTEKNSLAPSSQTIKNILSYSKSLSVNTSKYLGVIDYVKN